MDTVQKGDKFERNSLSIIKKIIEDERLGLLKDHVKIFEKKGYYSDVRESEIIFDLTIEVWPPNADRFALIYFIECKDYAKNVPVDDIEEFINKIGQVSGINAKGIFIAKNGLQKSALNIAKNKGLMLVQGESIDNFKIVLYKTQRNEQLYSIPYLNKNIENVDVETKLIEKDIDKKLIYALSNKENLNPEDGNYGIERLSKEDIKQIAKEVFTKVSSDVGLSVKVDKLESYITNDMGFSLDILPLESKYLGVCNIREKKICIHQNIHNTSRYLFVLSHELGHSILHQNLKIDQASYNNFTESEYNFRTDKYDLTNPKQWIEWQANYFASSLILPEPIFIVQLEKVKKRNGFTKRVLYVDDQLDNIKRFSKLIGDLAYIFSTSKTNIIYRLQDINLINNQSNIKSIGQIITENYGNLFI